MQPERQLVTVRRKTSRLPLTKELSMLTQETLKNHLHYNQETGLFTRLKSSGPSKAGDLAGGSHHSGYIFIRVCGNKYAAHRLAFLYMNGEFPKNQIDHKNQVRDDNSWSNIRHVTSTENCQNRGISSLNTSGFTGVCWHKRDGVWQARIKINRKYVHLGCFESINDAIAARKAANIEYGFHENHGR